MSGQGITYESHQARTIVPSASKHRLASVHSIQPSFMDLYARMMTFSYLSIGVKLGKTRTRWLDTGIQKLGIVQEDSQVNFKT